MNNIRLKRETDNAKRTFESIIDDLISEIEELESDKEKLENEINELKETIEK